MLLALPFLQVAMKYDGVDAECLQNQIRYFRKPHNTDQLFALQQWTSNSLKHSTVPRVINLYCFYVKSPHNVLYYGIGK